MFEVDNIATLFTRYIVSLTFYTNNENVMETIFYKYLIS